MEEALAIVEEEGQVAGPSLSPDQRFLVNHLKLGHLQTPLTKNEESVLEYFKDKKKLLKQLQGADK